MTPLVYFEDLPEFAKQAVEKRFTDVEEDIYFSYNCTYEWFPKDYDESDIEIDFNDWIEENYGEVEFILIEA